ncbi:hypothetical protein CTEN210_00265 [Chaetoceros tenuissimus]|uniref:Leucine-rich repeat domain-containing protein n=1 Tax=Chaetoceros tenuissimus TaxID=426638 RepID=A0AAD3CCX1_9STRA|nr:hypothetical protein CTEN210_00265 [Chaetoceros tenuissimus]
MRVATIDGLVTLFYDGSKELWNENLNWERSIALLTGVRANDLESSNVSDECKRYFRERHSWEQIIIVDGVTEIPYMTFGYCRNIKRVIFANTVIRIERNAFYHCENLVFIKWSVSLVYIGKSAFEECNLSSVFLPPTCREICDSVFYSNRNLSILHFPQETELGEKIIYCTALAEASPNANFPFYYRNNDMNQWLKNMNIDNQFALHRACSSFQPLKEVINAILIQKGLKAFKEKNSAGITPSRYLQENPYTDLSEKEIIHDYLMKMIDEVE